MLRTVVLSHPDWAEELREPWEALIRSSVSATPFQSYDWQSTWWCHFGKAREPRVLAFYEVDRLVGLMPMAKLSGPWRALRAIGTGHSDYLHPLSEQGYESEVARAVVDWLDQSTDFDVADLHQIREIQPLADGFARSSKQATCLVLDLPSTFDQYLETLSKSLRYDVRRLNKLMAKEGVEVIPASSDTLQADLTVLFETHRKRWRKRGLPGAFGKKSEAFHRDWATPALASGRLWLSVLRQYGEPIGAIYAMRENDTCYYYQAGFDPGAKSISPGTLLVAFTIRRAIAEGLKHFDFMRGDEPYKRRWKPQHEFANLRLIEAKANWRGAVAEKYLWRADGVESKIRARLEGKGIF